MVSGNLIFAANFDRYGSVLSQNSLGGSSNLGYTSAPSDPSGLIYLNARFYSPSIGSFLTHDPLEGSITSPGSFNGYSYVGSNPATFTDRSGKFFPLLFAGLVLLLGGLTFGGLPAAVEWRTAHDCGCGPSEVQNANAYEYVAGRTAIGSGIGLAVATIPEIALPLALAGAGLSINQAASNWNSSNQWETLQRGEGIFGTVLGLSVLPFATNTTSEALNSRLWYLSSADPLFHPDVVYPQIQGYLWQQLATSTLVTGSVQDDSSAFHEQFQQLQGQNSGDFGAKTWLSNSAIRQWYNDQVSQISNLNEQWIGQDIPLIERAKMASEIRHGARIQSRQMMSNPGEVAELQARDMVEYGNPDGPTFEYLVNKAINKGFTGNDIYEYIIGSSNRTNTDVNKRFGVDR